MAKIAAKGKLTVGVKFDQPGFGLKDAVSGKVDGFDIQVAREIASALGLSESQVEFVETVSVDRIPALASGRVDLVVATMTVTPEREAEIDFSRPYYVAGQSILVRKGSTAINGLQDLAGRKVCSVRGSTSEQTLREKAPEAELVLLDGYAACVRDLKAGSVDAVSTDDVILAGFAASDNTLKLVGGQFTREPYGVGVPKGQADFVAFINAVLDGAIADGSWERSYDKYLGKVEGLPRAAEAKAKLPRE